MVRRLRNPRDTEPMPITHPMLHDELSRVRGYLLSIALMLIGLGLLVIWCIA